MPRSKVGSTTDVGYYSMVAMYNKQMIDLATKSPYKDKFNYDNSNHTRDNVKFTDRRVDHAYDRHAKKCYGMEGNRNKQNQQEFVKRNQNHIQSPETKKINGSYRYADSVPLHPG